MDKVYIPGYSRENRDSQLSAHPLSLSLGRNLRFRSAWVIIK